jgi:hypothetical protein
MTEQHWLLIVPFAHTLPGRRVSEAGFRYLPLNITPPNRHAVPGLTLSAASYRPNLSRRRPPSEGCQRT